MIDRIYTPPDHDLPEDFLESGGRHYRREYYHLRYSEHRHTPVGELKPNPDLLAQIVTDFGVTKAEAVYVGDSRHKDVAMAKDAGIDYAWASYGEAQDTEAYEMLKLVTHWSDEDVRREREIRSRRVEVDVELRSDLAQLLTYYQFAEYSQ